MSSNQGSHSQIKNDETPGAEYPNKYDLQDTETNKTSAIANFLSQVLPDAENAEGIISLNLKQREVFNAVQTWVEDYVKWFSFRQWEHR